VKSETTPGQIYTGTWLLADAVFGSAVVCLPLCRVLEVVLYRLWANYAFDFMAFEHEETPFRAQQEPRCPPSPCKHNRSKATTSVEA